MEKTQEQWKQVAATDKRVYLISNMGRVLSRKKRTTDQRLLTPSMDKDGYMVFSVCGRQYKVHRLVAFAFCRKKSGCLEVNHINGIKSDNRACNLEWTDHGGNQQHRRQILRHGKCRLVHSPTKQQYASLWEAYKKTGTPILKMNHDIVYGGGWGWKALAQSPK